MGGGDSSLSLTLRSALSILSASRFGRGAQRAGIPGKRGFGREGLPDSVSESEARGEERILHVSQRKRGQCAARTVVGRSFLPIVCVFFFAHHVAASSVPFPAAKRYGPRYDVLLLGSDEAPLKCK